MIEISYIEAIFCISLLWILIRGLVCFMQKKVEWKREWQLLFVYVCIVVVVRFTFFPFATVDGHTQPLIYDSSKLFPLRINLIPFVHMIDYPSLYEIVINFVGNTVMFIPLGIVWPCVFKELNTAFKTIVMGAVFSLCIEVLQLPFYDRVSDVDDLILNTVGFMIGYGIYFTFKIFLQVIKRNDS